VSHIIQQRKLLFGKDLLYYLTNKSFLQKSNLRCWMICDTGSEEQKYCNDLTLSLQQHEKLPLKQLFHAKKSLWHGIIMRCCRRLCVLLCAMTNEDDPLRSTSTTSQRRTFCHVISSPVEDWTIKDNRTKTKSVMASRLSHSPRRKAAVLISVPRPWASSEPTLQPSG